MILGTQTVKVVRYALLSGIGIAGIMCGCRRQRADVVEISVAADRLSRKQMEAYLNSNMSAIKRLPPKERLYAYSEIGRFYWAAGDKAEALQWDYLAYSDRAIQKSQPTAVRELEKRLFASAIEEGADSVLRELSQAARNSEIRKFASNYLENKYFFKESFENDEPRQSEWENWLKQYAMLAAEKMGDWETADLACQRLMPDGPSVLIFRQIKYAIRLANWKKARESISAARNMIETEEFRKIHDYGGNSPFYPRLKAILDEYSAQIPDNP